VCIASGYVLEDQMETLLRVPQAIQRDRSGGTLPRHTEHFAALRAPRTNDAETRTDMVLGHTDD